MTVPAGGGGGGTVEVWKEGAFVPAAATGVGGLYWEEAAGTEAPTAEGSGRGGLEVLWTPAGTGGPGVGAADGTDICN